MDRWSFRTGITAAMSQGNASHGTVTWIPLAGRMEWGSEPSSRERTWSAQTPAALTTTEARTVRGSAPTGSIRAPDTLPSGPCSNASALQ